MADTDAPHVAKLYPTPSTAAIPKDGKARMWKGMTDDGIEVEMWVTAIRVADRDVARFERGLGADLRIRQADELEDRAYHAPRAVDPRLLT